MKLSTRRAAFAALTLVVCLALSPVAEAAPLDGRSFREKIVKIIKKLRSLTDIRTLEDFPLPPKP